MKNLYEMSLTDLVSEHFKCSWLDEPPRLFEILSQQEKYQLAFAHLESHEEWQYETLGEAMCVHAEHFEQNAIARKEAYRIFWTSLIKKGLDEESEVDPKQLVDSMATMLLGYLEEQISDDLDAEIETYCRNWINYQSEEEVWERLDGVTPLPCSYQ